MQAAPTVAWSMVLAVAAAAPAQVVLNPTIPNIFVSSCVHSGGAVHALAAGPTGTFTYTALYARSTDGGRTWPLREVPLGACNHFGGTIAASGNTVVAFLRQDLNPLVEVHSIDGGTTWSAPRALAPFGTDLALHVDGTTVNVFYYAFQSGAGWLWHNRSTDGGATWLAMPRSLDGNFGVQVPANSPRPQCFGVGGDLHVFWVDSVSGSMVMHQRSTDGGATWLPAPQNLGPGEPWGIVASSSVLFVGTTPSQRSTDNGTTWSPVTVPGLSAPAFAGDGANVIAAQGAVFTQGPNFVAMVMVNTSIDGGLTWRSQPMPVMGPFFSASQLAVALRPFVVGDAWYVQVHILGTGLAVEALRLSVDQGTTWRTVASPLESFWPAPSRIVAISHATPQRQARVLAGHSFVGAGTNGSGGIEPQLRGVGIPAPGLDFTLELTNALGGSFALLGFGVGAPVSLPFGSATVFVPLPITSLFVPTGGTAGVPGSGGFTWVQPVPNDLVFAGLQLVSQGLVWDAGAADGFAVTAGVASTLH